MPTARPVSVGSEDGDLAQFSHLLRKGQQTWCKDPIIICNKNVLIHCLFAFCKKLMSFLYRIYSDNNCKAKNHEAKNCGFHFVLRVYRVASNRLVKALPI